MFQFVPLESAESRQPDGNGKRRVHTLSRLRGLGKRLETVVPGQAEVEHSVDHVAASLVLGENERPCLSDELPLLSAGNASAIDEDEAGVQIALACELFEVFDVEGDDDPILVVGASTPSFAGRPWTTSSTPASPPYRYEDIPAVHYFTDRAALHVALWHDRFCHPASHGCVNLAPSDADRLFAFTAHQPCCRGV